MHIYISVSTSVSIFALIQLITPLAVSIFPSVKGYKIKKSPERKTLRRTKKMARIKGFEPPALSLGGRCSILLSYMRIYEI